MGHHKKPYKAQRAVLLTSALAVMFLAGACTHNKEIRYPSQKTAIMHLHIAGTNSSNARTTGTSLPTQAGENTINQIAIGVFQSSGAVNTIEELKAEDGFIGSREIYCSPGQANEVIVVANAPEGLFTGVTNKNDFIAKTVTLASTQRTVDGVPMAEQNHKNLPMSGQTTGVELKAGISSPVTVKLHRLVARISIKNIEADFSENIAFPNARLTIDHIFLYRALAVSKTAPGDATQTMPDNAQADPAMWIHGATATAGIWQRETVYILDELVPTVDVTAAKYTKNHWFYTFANNIQSHATRLVIAGMFKENPTATPQRTYYPIVVNKKQAGTTISSGTGDGTIARNMLYNISATIKNKGIDDPGGEMDPASIKLMVEVQEWEKGIDQDVVIE